MSLLGPDGKEITPKSRVAPTRQEKFNMVYMMFTLMSRAERQVLIKTLRPLRRKLDDMYPNGMTEDDIKKDIEKQTGAINAKSSGPEGGETPSNADQGLRADGNQVGVSQAGEQ